MNLDMEVPGRKLCGACVLMCPLPMRGANVTSPPLSAAHQESRPDTGTRPGHWHPARAQVSRPRTGRFSAACPAPLTLGGHKADALLTMPGTSGHCCRAVRGSVV